MKSKLKYINKLEKKIKYDFNNKDLLEEALTHSSFKNNSNSNQERLEFIGDRVLGLVIAEFLFQNFLSEREGVLTNKFRYLVQNKQCTKIAEKLDIINYLQLGNSEKNKTTHSILADSMEALLGAVYLDGGYDVSKKVILSLWDEYLNNDEILNATVSSKNILQEYLHANSFSEASYSVISKDGEDHKPSFLVEVSVDKIGKVNALGKSIKEAEINAAKKFIDEFEIG
ncbi:MAG: ribonuclease III [Rhodobiaceae bacterium]|nr:ribonuclease III [Rhodobiaceae bacterium]